MQGQANAGTEGFGFLRYQVDKLACDRFRENRFQMVHAQKLYLGWNVFGFQFYKPACYCQVCGYALHTVRDAIKVVVDMSKVSYETMRDIQVMCQKVQVECEIR